ncbi:MAG: universal stress protein [Halobacteriaceae archaeon]
MPRHVLVPVDGSPLAFRALEYVFEEFPDAAVVAVHVVNVERAVYALAPGAGGPTLSPDSWLEFAREEGEAVLEGARERARAADVDLSTDLVYGDPRRAIVEYAEERDVDLVAMGSHGREGLSRVLLGSVAEGVMRHAPCPVLVVR